jgi:hypothetical protein
MLGGGVVAALVCGLPIRHDIRLLVWKSSDVTSTATRPQRKSTSTDAARLRRSPRGRHAERARDRASGLATFWCRKTPAATSTVTSRDYIAVTAFLVGVGGLAVAWVFGGASVETVVMTIVGATLGVTLLVRLARR